MNRDHIIEKINAYRKLLDLTLKTVTKDEKVQAEVQAEFKSWVEAQLANLMGDSNGDGFSPAEMTVLKAFAGRMISKGTTEPVQTQQAANQPPQLQALQQALGITQQQKEIAARAKPLRDKPARSEETDPLLRRLEEMDRSGPTF